MSNYQNNLNHWRHQAREEEDRKARMNMGIGNFLAEISSSESEEYQTRDPGYEPTQSVKDYSQSSQTRNTNLSCLKLNWKKRNNFVLEDEMQHTCDRAGSNLPKLQSCRSCIVYDKFYNKVVDCNLLINGIDFSRHAT